MDEVGVPAQPELGREEPEVVLAGDEVRRGRHMDHDVDVGGVDAGVDEGSAPGPERQDHRRRGRPRPGVRLRRPPNS